MWSSEIIVEDHIRRLEERVDALEKKLSAPRPEPKPSIGRIVHYTYADFDGSMVVTPAIILDVLEGGTAVLHCFVKPSDEDRVLYADHSSAKAGTLDAWAKWSWPEVK